MDPDLLEKWLAFCRGEADFDKAEFLTLLHDDRNNITRNEIEIALASFDCRDLVDGVWFVKQVQKTGFRDFTAEAAMNLALADARNICKLAGMEFVKPPTIICHKGKREFLDFSIRRGFCNITELIEQVLKSKIANRMPIHFALFEALYGLASNIHLRYVLAAPVFGIDVGIKTYLPLWAMASDYDYLDGQIDLLTD